MFSATQLQHEDLFTASISCVDAKKAVHYSNAVQCNEVVGGNRKCADLCSFCVCMCVCVCVCVCVSCGVF